MIAKGEPWERPAGGPAQWQVEGDDADLAAVVRDHPGARIAFHPAAGSDLARAIGVHGRANGGARGGADGALELPLDALRITADDRALFAVNMVVVGTPPDRTRWTTPAPSLRVEVDGRARHEGPATSVVVATGQHLRGLDLVPRGHPGDGRAEVQVYALDRGARSELRRRLATGVHLPHPDVTQAAGRRTVIVALGKPARLEVDGVEVPAASRLVVEVVPEAYAVVV